MLLAEPTQLLRTKCRYPVAPPFASVAGLYHQGRCGASGGEQRRWRGLDGGNGVDGGATSAGDGLALGSVAWVGCDGPRSGAVAVAEVRRGHAGRAA